MIRENNVIQEVKYRDIGIDERTHRQHVHTNSCEIMLCYTDGGYMLMNERIYPLTRHGFYIINAAMLHCSVPESAAEYERSMVMIRSSTLISAASALEMTEIVDKLLISENGAYIRLDQASAVFADNLMLEINTLENSNGKFKNAHILSLVMLLLLRVSRDNKILTQPRESGLSVILNYINDHITEPLLLEDIAAAAGLNKYYICRLFKSKTNMTVSEYITERRLIMAKSLLINSDRPVVDIAFEVGFKSVSYFCSVFKAHENVVPLVYREKYQKPHEVI